ncbi:MAG: SAM-dependent methyltransferase [Burkholderiales bacterium]|nr:SAM-dependent methyltransferase [Bacteroidia bacterium]
MELSEEYWNCRYAENNAGWDIGNVSPPIKEYIKQLSNKELAILIPGAGNAYEAEFLYHSGFKNTYVLDFAELPLQNIKKRMPDFPDKQLIQQDFFLHIGQYDLIIEQTFFCAIHPGLRKQYAQHMKSLLKPGGKLVGLLFNDTLNNEPPPFGGNKQEYELLFSELFEIKIMEPCNNSIKPREGRELFVIMQVKA